MEIGQVNNVSQCLLSAQADELGKKEKELKALLIQIILANMNHNTPAIHDIENQIKSLMSSMGKTSS